MMELQIFGLAKGIGTPLALGGFFAVIFFLLIKKILEKDIFPSLTKSMSSSIIKKILDYLFILALVAMCLGFISYILPSITPTNDKYNSAEKQTTSLKREIDILRPEFEIFKENKHSSQVVLEKAAKIAESLSAINDNQLAVQFKIIKYGYASYAYFMAATVDSNKKLKKQYAYSAIKHGEKALVFIQHAFDSAKNGSEKDQQITTWVRDYDEQERTLYIIVAAYAISFRLNAHNKDFLVKKALQTWERIPTAYKKKYPPERNEDLTWFLTKYYYKNDD